MSIYIVQVPCANDCGHMVTKRIKSYHNDACRLAHGRKNRAGFKDAVVEWGLSGDALVHVAGEVAPKVAAEQEMGDAADEIDSLLGVKGDK
jgi:hypothetical protein